MKNQHGQVSPLLRGTWHSLGPTVKGEDGQTADGGEK